MRLQIICFLSNYRGRYKKISDIQVSKFIDIVCFQHQRVPYSTLTYNVMQINY